MSEQRLFGPFNLLTKSESKELIKWVSDETPESWPNKDFSNIPYSDYLSNLCKIYSNYANEILLNSDEIKKENKAVIFICLSYSNKGKSKCSEYPIETNDEDFNKIYVLFFNSRSVYEVLSILLFSPIIKQNRLLEGAVSTFNLALSSRLVDSHNNDLDRIALGLTAKYGKLLIKVEKEREIPFNFFSLLQDSKLSESEISNILWTISQFILGHEFAHILYKTHSNVKKFTEQYLDATFKWLKEDKEHISTHFSDKEFFEKVLNEATSISTDSNIFSKYDYEEFCCDIFAINSIISNEELNLDMIPIIRTCLVFNTQLIRLFAGWKDYFQIVSGVYQEIAKKDIAINLETIDGLQSKIDLSDSGVIESHKIAASRLNRTRTINELRKFISDKYINLLLWQFLNIKIPDNEDFNISIINNGNYFYNLWAEFEKEFLNKIDFGLTGMSATKLSSLGRSIQMFYSTIDHPLTSRLDADPFSFYLFGHVPTYSKHITEF